MTTTRRPSSRPMRSARSMDSAVFPDDVTVPVIDRVYGGFDPVAVVELVSPGNKDRPERRGAFEAKCARYLQQGIGLVIVDIVTERQTNLHNELIRLLEQSDSFALADDPAVYTVAYRPSRRENLQPIQCPCGIGPRSRVPKRA